MKKTKKLGFLFIGLLLFLPSVKFSPAQESYVGVQDGDKYLWKFGLHKINWGAYFEDQLEDILGNLWPLGGLNMTPIYFDWFWVPVGPPQLYWPLNITSIGSEFPSTILIPYDNTTLTATPVYGRTGWHLSYEPDWNVYYDGFWYIVNDTASFLRQTLNLTLAFSLYGIMNVPFVPKTIDWDLFVSLFEDVMNSKGGLYKNTSAIARSNGYSINVAPGGYENNTYTLEINVKYNSKGVLEEYEFIYGGGVLANYWLARADSIPLEDMLTIIWGGGLIIGITLVVFLMRWVIKHNN